MFEALQKWNSVVQWQLEPFVAASRKRRASFQSFQVSRIRHDANSCAVVVVHLYKNAQEVSSWFNVMPGYVSSIL